MHRQSLWLWSLSLSLRSLLCCHGRRNLCWKTKEEYTIILSSRRDWIAREGVCFILVSEQMLQCFESYEIVSPRMLTVSCQVQDEEGTLNISQVYAPTSAYSESESDSFYDILQLHIEKILRKESAIGMGDLNAKVGADHNTWTPSMDKYGLGKANSRGDNLLVFCTLHKLAVCNAYVQH